MIDIQAVCLFSFLAVICLALVQTVRTTYRNGIRSVPGPFVAKFSILYRLSMVSQGKAPEEYGKLHEKYGDIVRVGPKQVSVNDHTAISQIYGISSRFGKVSY